MKNHKTSTSSKPPPSSSHKHAPSSSDRKSRWESADGASTPKETKAAKPLNPKELENKEVPSSSAVAIGGPGRPSPAPVPGGGSEASPFPAPTPPTYGFQNLERRTIVLFDGSVRSYFALPRDYPSDPYMHGFDRFSPDRFRQPPLRDFGAPQDYNTPNDFGHPRDFGPPRDHWLDGPRGTSDSGPSSMKRKYPEEDEFAWHRHHISQYGNPNPNLNPNLDRSPMRSRYEDDPRASKQVKLEGGDGYAQQQPSARSSKALSRALVVLNFAMLVLGASCTPLLLRLYFVNGGSRKWLSSWLQTAAFPLTLAPLSISYCRRRRTPGSRPCLITAPLLAACAALGLVTGLVDFLYAYGMSYLPVSTSSILNSTQLGFTAVFAFALVRQRFTAYSVNAIALLSFGAVVLGIGSSGDRPEGEGRGQYYAGFVMTLGAAALYGMVLPMVELAYAKAGQAVTYTLVMEMQLVMGFFATAFCTVGMLLNHDFQAMQKEARDFKTGEVGYYMVLVWSAVFSQFFYLGVVGVIHQTSALLSGIIIAVLIPVTEVLAVIFFHETFNGGKGVALALSIWGFISYFYGEFKASRKKQTVPPVKPSVSDAAT